MTIPPGHCPTVTLLLARGADCNVASTSGVTPLMSAARAGHHDVVETLLGHGVDVNVGDNKGMTALMLASKNGMVID